MLPLSCGESSSESLEEISHNSYLKRKKKKKKRKTNSHTSLYSTFKKSVLHFNPVFVAFWIFPLQHLTQQWGEASWAVTQPVINRISFV